MTCSSNAQLSIHTLRQGTWPFKNFNNAKKPCILRGASAGGHRGTNDGKAPDFFEEEMDYLDDTSADLAQSAPKASLTIYTRDNCGDCEKSIKLLQDLAINFVKLTSPSTRRSQGDVRKSGRHNCKSPQIFDAEHFIGGYQALAKRYAPENKSDASRLIINIVLYQPEIPPNTGNILRLLTPAGAHLHLIRPLGLSLNDKTLKRAGLDYISQQQFSLYDDWVPSLKNNNQSAFCASTKTEQSIQIRTSTKM